MSHVTAAQPESTPTWIDLGVPDPKAAEDFYAALFGWEYRPGADGTTVCLLDGRAAAGFRPVTRAPSGDGRWHMYLAADDCDRAAERVVRAGGTVLRRPADHAGQARTAHCVDPTGAPFGLWEGGTLLGCEVVNEPNSLVRNDLVTPAPARARDFYREVFAFTLDANEDLPGFDFTFLRRPDGHEIGGVLGDPQVAASSWETTFEVADTDATVVRCRTAGGTAGPVSDSPYGRTAQLTDPLGTTFGVIARPPAP